MMEAFPPPPLLGAQGSVVAIGKFDGVHVGHQAVLKAGRAEANSRSLPLIAVTFDPHPLAILAPDKMPNPLTPLLEKEALLKQYGADDVYVVPFTKAFSQKTAQDFIDDIVVSTLNAKHVVVGENFRFGHKAQGDGSLLKAQNTFEATLVPSVKIDGKVVSSSWVRELMMNDQKHLVHCLLGR